MKRELQRRGVLDSIRASWRRRRWCAIVAPPMSGKSTLAHQLEAELQSQGHRNGMVVFGEQDLTLERAVQSMLQAADASCRQLPPRELMADGLANLMMQSQGTYHLLVDELDVLPDEVVRLLAAELRRFLNEDRFDEARSRLHGALFGADKLFQLADRPHSPLLGLVDIIRLPDLTPEEAKELFDLLSGAVLDLEGAHVLYSETAGHPHLVAEIACACRAVGAGTIDRAQILRAGDNWSNDALKTPEGCLHRALRYMHDDWQVCDTIIALAEDESRPFRPALDDPLLLCGVLSTDGDSCRFRGDMIARALRIALDDLRKADLLSIHGNWEQAHQYYQQVASSSVWTRRGCEGNIAVQRVLDLYLGVFPAMSRQSHFSDAADFVVQASRYFLGATRAVLWELWPGEEIKSLTTSDEGHTSHDTPSTEPHFVLDAIRHHATLRFADNRGVIHPIGDDATRTRWALEVTFCAGLYRNHWVEATLRYVESTLGMILERAREREAAAHRRKAQRALIHSITLNLQRASQLQDVFRQIIEGVTKELGYECAQLSLVFVDDRRIRAVACDEVFEPIRTMTDRELDGDDILALVTREKQWQIVDDCGAPGSHCEQVSREICQMKSLIVIPLIDRAECVGVLQVGDTQATNAFTREDAEILQPVADAAAVAITMSQVREDVNRMIDATGDAMAMIDRKGQIRWCNETYSRLFDRGLGQPTCLTSEQPSQLPLVRVAFDQEHAIQTVRPVGVKNYIVTAAASQDSFGGFSGGVEVVGVRHPLYGLADSLAELLGATTEHELAVGIVECLCDRLGYARSRLYALRNDLLVSVASYGMSCQAAGRFERGEFQLVRNPDDSHGDGFECLRLQRPVVIVRNDRLIKADRELPVRKLSKDSRQRHVVCILPEDVHYPEELEKHDVCEWADTPLIAGGVPLGKLSVDLRGGERRLGLEDLELLALFGQWVAQALHRLEMLEKARREAMFLKDVSVLAEGRGFEAAAWDFILNITLDGGPGFNRAALFLKRPGTEEISGFLCHGAADREEWEPIAKQLSGRGDRYGFVTDARRRRMHEQRSAEDRARDEALRRMHVNLSCYDSPLSTAAVSCRTTGVTPDAPMPPDFYRALGWQPAQTAIICPLLYEGVCEGVLYVDKAFSDHNITEDDTKLLEAMCFHLAAIARPVRLAEHLTAQICAVSHTTISPMTAVRGLAEAVREELADASQQHLLDVIIAEAQRASDTLTRFLRSASLDQTPEIERRALDLVEILEERVLPYRTILERDGVCVSVSVPPRSIIIEADRNLLGDVFAELASNALEVLKDSDTDGVRLLRIRASVSGGQAHIVFENSGEVVPETFQPRLFERFASSRGSTGIGLFLARRFVELHGGTISYEISRDRTSVFRVYLPVSDPDISEVNQCA